MNWLTEFNYRGLSDLCLQLSRFNMAAVGFDLCHQDIRVHEGVQLHTMTHPSILLACSPQLTDRQHSLEHILGGFLWLGFLSYFSSGFWYLYLTFGSWFVIVMQPLAVKVKSLLPGWWANSRGLQSKRAPRPTKTSQFKLFAEILQTTAHFCSYYLFWVAKYSKLTSLHKVFGNRSDNWCHLKLRNISRTQFLIKGKIFCGLIWNHTALSVMIARFRILAWYKKINTKNGAVGFAGISFWLIKYLALNPLESKTFLVKCVGDL